MLTNSVDKNPGEYEYTKKKRPTWIIRHSCLYIYTNNHTSLALEQHTTTCKQNVYMKTNCFQYTKCVYHQCVWRKKIWCIQGNQKRLLNGKFRFSAYHHINSIKKERSICISTKVQCFSLSFSHLTHK